LEPETKGEAGTLKKSLSVFFKKEEGEEIIRINKEP
jgi:hypothetical protein